MEFPCSEHLLFHVNSPQEIVGQPLLRLYKATRQWLQSLTFSSFPELLISWFCAYSLVQAFQNATVDNFLEIAPPVLVILLLGCFLGIVSQSMPSLLVTSPLFQRTKHLRSFFFFFLSDITVMRSGRFCLVKKKKKAVWKWSRTCVVKVPFF